MARKAPTTDDSESRKVRVLARTETATCPADRLSAAPAGGLGFGQIHSTAVLLSASNFFAA